MINDGIGFGAHAKPYAIIGSLSQGQSCDYRDCDSRKFVSNGAMTSAPKLRPEAQAIFDRLDSFGLNLVNIR